MKTKIVEFWVGVFVILGICSLLMLALQVSGLTSVYHEKGYVLKAVFKNIGGLKIKSKVLFKFEEDEQSKGWLGSTASIMIS